MTFKLLRSISITIFFSFTFLSMDAASQVKSKVDERVAAGAERVKKANEVIKRVSALPEGKGIPKEVSEKMNLVGVIPDASELSLLFSKGFKGHGVSSIKQDTGWSLPAFYQFGQANGFDLTGIGSKHFDIIMIVVNARFAAKEGDKKDTDKTYTADKPRRYFYAFTDGVLKPLDAQMGLMATLLGAQTALNYDQDSNKAVYGVGGDDVQLGKVGSARTIPPEMMSYRDTLDQLFSVQK